MNFEKQRKGENFCQVRKTWITCPLVLSWAACKSFTKSLTVLLRKRTNTVYCSLLLPQNCYISSDLWHLQCICSSIRKLFMAYLVGKLIESIASDGLTDPEHYQCSHCWLWGVLQTGKLKLSTWEIFVLIFALVVNAVNSFIKLGDSQLLRVSDKRRNSIYAKNNKR